MENKPQRPEELNKTNMIKIESILNKGHNKLPFSYYNPSTDGKLVWSCGYDHENKIVSVFSFDEKGPQHDRKISVLPDIETAINTKKILIKDGWVKVDPPKITTTREDGKERPLSRKQKRKLAKKIKNMSKNETDPF
jgi:hypothetical protein